MHCKNHTKPQTKTHSHLIKIPGNKPQKTPQTNQTPPPLSLFSSTHQVSTNQNKEKKIASFTHLPGRALAEERADAIYASRTVEARRSRAIVNVLRAVVSRPAVHADAREAALGVGARGAVLNVGNEKNVRRKFR